MRSISPDKAWSDFINSHPTYAKREVTEIYHFCYEKRDADALAELVKNGIKTATSSLHILYEEEGETLPQVGEISIITDYDGCAKAIIETTLVELVRFSDVSADFAYREGEGDRSLDYWQRVHREFFTAELRELGIDFDENMLVVLEQFKVIDTV